MKLSDIPILIHTIQYDVGPPFAAITASPHLERLSTRFKVGIFDLYSRDTLLLSDPFIPQMLLEVVCMQRCFNLHTCGCGSDWNA